MESKRGPWSIWRLFIIRQLCESFYKLNRAVSYSIKTKGHRVPMDAGICKTDGTSQPWRTSFINLLFFRGTYRITSYWSYDKSQKGVLYLKKKVMQIINIFLLNSRILLHVDEQFRATRLSNINDVVLTQIPSWSWLKGPGWVCSRTRHPWEGWMQGSRK